MVPADERAYRRIGWAVHEDEVRLTERRAPEFPELTTAWSITPLAKLRYGMPGPGLWTIYRPGAEPGTWERFGTPSRDPFELLARAAR